MNAEQVSLDYPTTDESTCDKVVVSSAFDVRGRYFLDMAALMARSLRVRGQFAGRIVVFCQTPVSDAELEELGRRTGARFYRWLGKRVTASRKIHALKPAMMRAAQAMGAGDPDVLWLDSDFLAFRRFGWLFDFHRASARVPWPQEGGATNLAFGGCWHCSELGGAAQSKGVNAGAIAVRGDALGEFTKAWQATMAMGYRKGYPHSDQSALNATLHRRGDFRFWPRQAVQHIVRRDGEKSLRIDAIERAALTHFNGLARWRAMRAMQAVFV